MSRQRLSDLSAGPILIDIVMFRLRQNNVSSTKSFNEVVDEYFDALRQGPCISFRRLAMDLFAHLS